MTNAILKGVMIVAFLTLVSIGYAKLPDASEYPLPSVITEAITLIYGYITAFDDILPFDTLLQVLLYGIVIQGISRLVIPGVAMIIGYFAKVAS